MLILYIIYKQELDIHELRDTTLPPLNIEQLGKLFTDTKGHTAGFQTVPVMGKTAFMGEVGNRHEICLLS